MGVEMRAEIESMLGEYRDMRARLMTLMSELAALTATGRSSDGMVTATVNPHGDMVDLDIDESAVRRVGFSGLVPSILEASGRASMDARTRARVAMCGFLPQWMHDMIQADGSVDVAALLPSDPPDSTQPRA